MKIDLYIIEIKAYSSKLICSHSKSYPRMLLKFTKLNMYLLIRLFAYQSSLFPFTPTPSSGSSMHKYIPSFNWDCILRT